MEKTPVVYQRAPGNPYSEPIITVNRQILQVVDKFTYLWSTLSRAVRIDVEATARTAQKSWTEQGCKVCIAQLRWTGHVTRVPAGRLPKKVFYGELQVEKRSQGGQKKRYKDILKVSLNLPPESLEQRAQDRAKWRCLIRKGADDMDQRVCVAERQRKERKARAKGSSSVITFRIDLFYFQQTV